MASNNGEIWPQNCKNFKKIISRSEVSMPSFAFEVDHHDRCVCTIEESRGRDEGMTLCRTYEIGKLRGIGEADEDNDDDDSDLDGFGGGYDDFDAESHASSTRSGTFVSEDADRRRFEAARISA